MHLRLKKVIAAVVIGVLLISVMYSTGPERDWVVLETEFRDGLSYVQGGILRIGDQLRNGFQNLFFFKIIGELDELRQQVRDLEGELVTLREDKLQNERLRQLLNYKNLGRFEELLVADVMSRDPGNWFETVKLNRGANDGVRRDMAVILPAGLVGRVVTVGPNTADVLLITDPHSRVGAMVQETRSPGVVKGALNGLLKMSYLTKDDQVKQGQLVITSGLGKKFPKGIPVGRIIGVQMDAGGLTKSAEVEPLVDFDHLEEVFIILNNNTLSPGA